MLCSKLSQSSMGPDIKGKNVYGKFLIPSHKLASLRSASKNEFARKIVVVFRPYLTQNSCLCRRFIELDVSKAMLVS